MTMIGNGVGPGSEGRFVLAFAKLRGENFEYYMQKYSIILGRGLRKNSVDLDLRRFGGNLLISRRHARIFYDFNFKCFALEVLGRNGCIIRNDHFMPGSPPIKLDSQDLVQMGEVSFYFLLPSRPFLVPPEAARHMVPPLPPILVAVPVANSNDERNGEERECNREESLSIKYDEGDVSGMIVDESDARDSERSCDVPSGGASDAAAGQIALPLLPPLVVVPPTSNNEMKGEGRKGEKENLGTGRGGGPSGMIVEEFNAREAGGSSSEQLAAGEAAKQIDLPLTPKLVAVPACINNERKGNEKEGDREEGKGTGHVEGGASGLVVEGLNSKEAGVLSSEYSADFKAAMQIESPLLPQLVLVPLASFNDQKNCEEKGEREEIAGVEHGEGDVCGLIAEFSAREAGGTSSGLSGALEAVKEIAPSPHSPLSVDLPTYSNNERKGKERDGDREEILGIGHGKDGGSGLIVEVSGMHSGDMVHFSLPNEILEPGSRSDREADKEETPDLHAFKADLPGIKEQIKLEVEHVDCHGARAGDQET